MVKKQKCCRAILIVLILLILLVGGRYFNNLFEEREINAIALNKQNGDIAISTSDEDGYPIVLVFDSMGNQKFDFKFYNDGGLIHDLGYDQDGNLYLYLDRKKTHIRVNPDGQYETNVNIGDFEYLSYRNVWDKKGSGYSVKLNTDVYCYDYANFIDYLIEPANKLYIQKANGETILLWES